MSDPRVIFANQGLCFEDGPDRGRIIVDGASTGGVYALMEWTVAVNPEPTGRPSYGPHRHHGCEETFMVQAGCLQFLLDDSIITLSHGDFVRVPSPHYS